MADYSSNIDATTHPVMMSAEQLKKVKEDQKIKMYKVICYCGIGFITYIDKFAVLEKLAEYDRGAASKCTFYFTFSLLCMLLGIVAASFPETAPFAMKISWNGSLQAFLFVIAYLHLSAIKYYAHVQQMFISFIVASTLFSLLWYFFTMDVDRSERRYSK